MAKYDMFAMMSSVKEPLKKKGGGGAYNTHKNQCPVYSVGYTGQSK